MSVVSIAEAWPSPGKPFTVAELLLTPLAATVVTIGAAVVVNCCTVPKPVPTELEAIAQ